jgi:uncharacterized protein
MFALRINLKMLFRFLTLIFLANVSFEAPAAEYPAAGAYAYLNPHQLSEAAQTCNSYQKNSRKPDGHLIVFNGSSRMEYNGGYLEVETSDNVSVRELARNDFEIVDRYYQDEEPGARPGYKNRRYRLRIIGADKIEIKESKFPASQFIRCGFDAAKTTSENPSFDCAKSSTVVEQTICSDEELARLDGQMGAAFQVILSSLQGDNRKRMLNEQRMWLARRNRECALETLKSCLVRSIGSRLSFLQAKQGSQSNRSIYKTGSFPMYSCNMWGATITELSGIDSQNAVVRGIVTKDDLLEYCTRTLPYLVESAPTAGQIRKCADEHLVKLRSMRPSTNLVSTADCQQRIVWNDARQGYQVIGVVRDGNLTEFRWKNLQSREIVGQSCGGGTIPAAEQFKVLCPATSNRILGNARRSSSDQNGDPIEAQFGSSRHEEKLSQQVKPQIAATYKTGSFPLASCKSWNGTITELSGVDGRHATMKGVIRREDLLEYCSRSPGGEVKNTGDGAEVEKCADRLLFEMRNTIPDRTNLVSIADCHQGTIRDTEERAYQLVGADPSTAWNELRWKHLRSGQLLDGSCASGTPPITEQFKLLCPSSAKKAVAAGAPTDTHLGLWYKGDDVRVCRQKNRVGRDQPDLVQFTNQGMKELMATCSITKSSIKQNRRFLALRCKHLEGDTYVHEEEVEVRERILTRYYNGIQVNYKKCPE